MYINRMIKCDYCQEEKIVRIRLADYVYKRKLYKSNKVVYFCGWNCMKKAEKEKPERYVTKREMQ